MTQRAIIPKPDFVSPAQIFDNLFSVSREGVGSSGREAECVSLFADDTPRVVGWDSGTKL